MSDKCGTQLTMEMFEKAVENALNQGMKLPERVISCRADKVLKKILRVYPNWDFWSTEAEIWFKARKMGITEE